MRNQNPDSDISFICNNNHGFERVFKNLNITHVPMDSLSDYHGLADLDFISMLKRHGTPNTKHPSPPQFFYRALERIFYLEAFANTCPTDIIHLENDVLVYYPFETILDANWRASGAYTPMGQNLGTFALCHLSWERLKEYRDFVVSSFALGEDLFCNWYGVDMLNEMTILGALWHDKYKLPIIPEDSEQYVFDPGSYGQYLGGTNNEHGPGWTGNHHYIGRYLQSKDRPVVRMENGKPMVEDTPIFNLHIHSKNLKDFYYEP